MPNKTGKRRTRNRNRNRLSAPMAPMANPTSRRTTFRRIFTDRRLLKMVAGTPQLVGVSHKNVLDTTSGTAIDWFDEFMIESYDVVLSDIDFSTGRERMLIEAHPNYNDTLPRSSSEMMRASQLSRLHVSQYNLKCRTICRVKKPQFSVTGDANQFRSCFLPCTSDSLDTVWLGAVISCSDTTTLFVDFVAKIVYRGFQ